MSFWVSIPFIFFTVILLWMAMYSYDKKRRRALAMAESASPVITVTPANGNNSQAFTTPANAVVYTIPTGYSNAHIHRPNQVTIIPAVGRSAGLHTQQSGIAYIYPQKYDDLPPAYDQIVTPNAPAVRQPHSSSC